MSEIKDAVYMPGGYVYNVHYHLIWVTKYRKSIFTTKEKRQSMLDLLKKIADLHEITIQEAEVMEDHVHLLVSFPPRLSITNVVKAFKGATARLWFQQYPKTKFQLWGGHLWSRSYYCGTVGNMSKEVVEKYIQGQRTSKASSGRKKKKNPHSSGE